ncbi:MAG: TrkH family potassium uptake protein [Treponema sp.]|nr:TrkH family potassium uptake protein [Treponema sp.]
MAFTVARVVFMIVAIVGLTFMLPIICALIHGEKEVLPYFIVPMAISFVTGAAFYFMGRKKTYRISTRASFVVVALAWAASALFGSIPYFASGAIPGFTDAFFESMSGFTTTGATILEEIEGIPFTYSINLWRCTTHWLGGMGIVALTVALMPLLGVGGFQLIRAETTGPEKGKLTAKITTTAKILWFMYFALTVLEAVLLKIAGMSVYEALCHALSTLGTGGFSTRNASVGGFSSPAIDWIITTFMFLAGINFSLYYSLIRRDFTGIKNNSELKAYLGIVFGSSILIALFEMGRYGGFFQSLRYSSFQSLSIISTAGFATDDYTTWSSASQAVIFILFFIGGCAGSTGGGVKVIRWVVLSKLAHNEVLRLLHPRRVFALRIDGEPRRNEIGVTVTAFFFFYLLLVFITTFIACLFGVDIMSSFSGAISMIGNVGPGFNLLGPSCNYAWLHPAVKWLYCFAMLAGRLEFFTMIMFFSPSFWKK